MRTTMRLYEQADRTGNHITYSWILDAGKQYAKCLGDWRWVRGKPGCFVTSDKQLAQDTARQFNLAVMSNGSALKNSII
jgi:hypothetical protein